MAQGHKNNIWTFKISFFSFDLGADNLSAWLDSAATVFIRAPQVTEYRIALKLG